VENTRTLTRRSVPVALLALAAMLLAACGTGPVGRRAAATVGGHEIGIDDVTDLMEAQTRYLESQRGNASVDPAQLDAALAQVSGVGEGTFSMSEAAGALQAWINYRITVAEVEARGGSITDADREDARAELAAQVGGEEALAEVDAQLLEFSIDSAAANKAFQRISAMTDEDREARLQELFAQTAAERPLCLSIIVSETEEDSEAALARIDDGEDFATVASEVSVDAQTAADGGFSGCASPERASEVFGGDYSTVARGDTVGPIEQETGTGPIYLLVHVTSTTGPTFEQLSAELEQQLNAEVGNRAAEQLYLARMTADVHVDPRFGTWDPETGAVTPPRA
jgi:hypothetical protein